MSADRDKGEHKMSVANIAERMVRDTMVERGLKKPEARAIVAREAGVKPGTIRRLCNGSLVHVERITDRMNAYAIRRLENKISQFEHELAVARLTAARADDVGILRAAAALDEAKKALKG
ncbi:MAG: hypothetical protein WC026_16735 [Hyphomicrobium sp.]|uniref:hypothetical protein n=1 Tax=Hyphomicrobium sp. TaxID=82 RepID=UPI003567D21D